GRRESVRLAAGAGALAVAPRPASARDDPKRSIRLIVGFPAASGPDIVARLMGHWLWRQIGQEVIVDDRPGAGGNIATEVVAKAAPDGYTHLLTVSANTINVTLYDKLNFDFARDLVPVGFIALNPFVIAVNPDFAA